MSYTAEEVRSYAALFWNGPSKDDRIASDMLHKYADLLQAPRPEVVARGYGYRSCEGCTTPAQCREDGCKPQSSPPEEP